MKSVPRSAPVRIINARAPEVNPASTLGIRNPTSGEGFVVESKETTLPDDVTRLRDGPRRHYRRALGGLAQTVAPMRSFVGNVAPVPTRQLLAKWL